MAKRKSWRNLSSISPAINGSAALWRNRRNGGGVVSASSSNQHQKIAKAAIRYDIRRRHRGGGWRKISARRSGGVAAMAAKIGVKWRESAINAAAYAGVNQRKRHILA